MEVVARDLKALGLYTSRVLSFKGVETEILTINLTHEQEEIYNTYARGFAAMQQSMYETFEATGIVSSEGKTLNGQAKGAAISAFEGMKQRFFFTFLLLLRCQD